MVLFITGLLALASLSSAFWFTSEEPKPTSPRLLYQPPEYYRQYVPPPIPYTIPVPVPVPAQLTPASVQNVQLVPCLCPVSQDYFPYENSLDYGTRKTQYVQPAQPSAQQRRK